MALEWDADLVMMTKIRLNLKKLCFKELFLRILEV